MELITFRELEQILLLAIKMPTIKIKSVAEQTGLGLSGLYKWCQGQNRISPDNADCLLNWFKYCRPDVLKAAEVMYKQRC